MPFEKAVIADLTANYLPIEYVRATLLGYSNPLGLGVGKTRFSSPQDKFKLLYAAKDLSTSIAETLVRDRFEGTVHRRLDLSEVIQWGATRVSAQQPLRVLDIRTTGLTRLGLSTDIARGKMHEAGRVFSLVRRFMTEQIWTASSICRA